MPSPVRAIRPGNGWYGCEHIIGWLLRVNRLYGLDERLAVAADFAKAYGRGGRPVGAYQITRWELARQRADYPVLQRYEQLLNLPRNHLVAVADAAYRESAGNAGPPPLDRGLDPESRQMHRRTNQLLDDALSNEPMSGHDWDELSANLSALRAAFLPARSWTELTERLLGEMIVACGSVWVQRNEALMRLLGHPAGEEPVIAACATLAADRTNQIFIEPLTAMDVSAHPDVAWHLRRQITDPTNDHAHRAAWLAMAEKIGRGHLTDADLVALCGQAAELLSSDEIHPGARVAAADLLRQAPPTVSAPVRNRLRRVTTTDQVSRNILSAGRIASAEVAGLAVARLAAKAAQRLPRDGLPTDPILEEILDQLLFHPHISRRVMSGMLISATPYRRPVAETLSEELRRNQFSGEPSYVCSIMFALGLLRGKVSRQRIEQLVLATGVPPAVSDAAAWSLGHVGGASHDDAWRAALARHTPRPGTAVPAVTHSTLRGLVFAMGVLRHEALLTEVKLNPAVPEPVRTAAGWWLNVPQRTQLSVAA